MKELKEATSMTIKLNATEVVYPDSDGEPMADNTLQFEWIVTIKGGLDALFQADPNVFVAGDLLWYPVRGSLTRLAPMLWWPSVVRRAIVASTNRGRRGASLRKWCSRCYLPATLVRRWRGSGRGMSSTGWRSTTSTIRRRGHCGVG